MPMYAFQCRKCGKEYEELVQRFGQKAPCPGCGSRDVQRVISAPVARTGDRLRARPSCSSCGGPHASGFR